MYIITYDIIIIMNMFKYGLLDMGQYIKYTKLL
jgi:hypothetical protein